MTFANENYLLHITAVTCIAGIAYLLYTWYRYYVVRTYFSRICSQSVLRYLLPMLLCVAALLLYSLLLLRPQWGFTLKKQRARGVDLVVALDVSRSMYTEDLHGSRLARAKDAVRYIAESLPGRMGLVVFAGDAFIQCPLTVDRAAYMMYLDYAGADAVALQGTDIGRAFEEAGRLFEKQNPNRKVLLLITDGEDHEKHVAAQLERLREKDVTVHTASVGRENGAPVPAADEDGSEIYLKDAEGNLVKSTADTRLLRTIANKTGGIHISLNRSAGHVKRIVAEVTDSEKSDFGSHYVREGKDRFYIFAFLCVAVLLLDLCVHIRWKR